MKKNIILFFWIFLAAIAAAIPVSLIKMYTETKNELFIILSFLSYSTLIYIYTIILLNHNITTIYPLVKIVSILLVVISGLLVFNDSLNTKIGTGLLFGFLSLYLLS
jgi:uncharacterized membrane protein